jgi:putative effector of murein hydrolase
VTGGLRDIWVYLAASPLLHLTLTLVAYQAGYWLYARAGLNPLLNPVLIGVVLLVGLLLLTGTTYPTYFEGAQFVHFLLGPATVCLAIPLYRQFDTIRRSGAAILAAILVGSLTASVTAVALVWLLGGSATTMISIAPKSVTAPIAMGIAEQLGGLPSLTAVLVILTGILGASLGRRCSTCCASATGRRGASPSARRATASEPRARCRSTRWRAPSPALPWG